MRSTLTIGQVAKATGITAKTIRYYEEAGVTPPPVRSPSGYRLYSETDVRRFDLIRRARALDMTLTEVRQLAELAGSEGCDAFQQQFQEVVRRKQEDVDRRIADLLTLKQDLQRVEAHLGVAAGDGSPGHTVLECSPGTCTCMGPRGTDQGKNTGGNDMPETTNVESTVEENLKQGGDCGCGCGGDSCHSSWQELRLVDSGQVTAVRQQAASQACDGACGCGGGSSAE
jgi:DNA-binding transcriptional MerR regulator